MKKGFTLIELLAVIIILAVIALIATPVVLNVVEEAKVKADRNSVYGLVDAAKLYYAESLLDADKKAYTNGTTNVLDYLIISGEGPESGKIFINDKGQSALAVVYGKVCFTKNFNEYELSESDDIENCELDIEETKVVYKDNILNGTDPVIKENLIPVVLSNDGTVKKADLYSEWYNYTNKNWANAVILKDKTVTYEDNEEIPSSNIDGYFVWIPRYKYEIFNVGDYTSVTTVDTAPTESAAQEINIVFESKDVTPSTGSTVGSYLTHPAFTTLDVNGIWVAKFETSGTTSDIDVLPNVTSLRSLDVKTIFETAYNYDRSLDSHMMKNTEWGAVAYLSHSKYGINQEIRINNSQTMITG
ncbi:MAG: prepilin-type N-terminal cleavage/methylation domain-containing protein, partial [Bacilli bacterium]|nr:prepilin-type N-terminal cleavage/methylation domain-containing protein [Bacilli bacterium]